MDGEYSFFFFKQIQAAYVFWKPDPTLMSTSYNLCSSDSF